MKEITRRCQKRRRRLRIKWMNIFVVIILMVCIVTFCISFKNIFSWNKDNNNIEKEIKEIEKVTEIVEVEDNENTQIILPTVEIPKIDLYWDYIKLDLISVDFKELKKINSSTVGWLQVLGTNINYPFVQGKDNDYYLTHSFNKKYNKAGWVFMDYRNNKNFTDKNTILYAHSRLDKTMFGTLKTILSNGWLKNPDNYVLKLSTETENTLWQVFSIYHIPETSDYIKFNFSSNEEFNDFTNMLIERSAHDFNTTVAASDKILTLSTCYKEDERMVLHAKLIKREKR